MPPSPLSVGTLSEPPDYLIPRKFQIFCALGCRAQGTETSLGHLLDAVQSGKLRMSSPQAYGRWRQAILASSGSLEFGAWWRQWWNTNKQRFPADVQALEVRTFEPPKTASQRVGFPSRCPRGLSQLFKRPSLSHPTPVQGRRTRSREKIVHRFQD